MSDNDKDVVVPFTDKVQEQAILLLAEAEGHEQGAGVVRTQTGAFLVPESIAKAAGQDYEDDEDGPERGADRALSEPQAVLDESRRLTEADDAEQSDDEKPTAKKTAAKKTAAKKSAAQDKE